MDRTIIVELKEIYGRELIYPENDMGKKLLQLTGKKSFDRNDLRLLKELGYHITRKNINF